MTQDSVIRPVTLPPAASLENLSMVQPWVTNEAPFELRDKVTGVPHLKGSFGYSHTSNLPDTCKRKK